MNIATNISDLIGSSKPIGSESVSYTKKPNIIFDEVMGQVSGNAYKCLDVIIRCTIGYHKADAQISESAFMSLTGIKRKETLRAAIRELEQVEIIKIYRKQGVTNTFILTPNQYGKSVLGLENSTSTKNPSVTSTENPSQTRTKNPSPNKENLKENFKESSSSVRPEFEVQKGVSFIHYFDHDFKKYKLEELCGVYDAKQNFFDQAKSSHPEVTAQQLDYIWQQLSGWSMTCLESWKTNKTPLQWMTTWLNSVAKNKYEKPKPAKQAPVSRNVNDQWGEVQQYAPASDIDTGDLL